MILSCYSLNLDIIDDRKDNKIAPKRGLAE